MSIEDDFDPPLHKDIIFWFVIFLIVAPFLVWICTKVITPKLDYEIREESVVRQIIPHYVPKFQYSVMACISGYNATVEQCDSTPFIMASGKRVYEGAIANNCLEFGTKVKIGEDWYVVEDRMNKRYGCRYFDIFFWDFDEAKQWGRRTIKIEIHH